MAYDYICLTYLMPICLIKHCPYKYKAALILLTVGYGYMCLIIYIVYAQAHILPGT